MLSCTVFSTLFAAALCLLTLRLIARPLKQVMRTLQKTSSGDLTGRLTITHQDEIGCMGLALNSFLESTCEVLQNVRQTAETLSWFQQIWRLQPKVCRGGQTPRPQDLKRHRQVLNKSLQAHAVIPQTPDEPMLPPRNRMKPRRRGTLS